MAGKVEFYQRIIESMNEGVMTLSPKGQITMFNDPAGKILGLLPGDVRDKPFGQVFMMEMEDNDQFCQVVMDAVYHSAVGQTDTIEFKRPDSRQRTLSVSTSYLRAGSTDQTDTGGVVVVFTDITEITRSREKEEELNLKLRNAFMDAEKTNQQLAAALKKVQWIRLFITVLVVLGFSGTGYYLWQKDLLPAGVFSGSSSAGIPDSSAPPEAPVMVQPLTSSISLSGFVAPLEEINVTAPFDGKIKKRFFVYDQRVEKGATLFTMDTDKLEVSFRDARASYIKALQKYRDLEDWKKGAEVASARRSFTKAQNSLDTSKRKLEENRVLFEKGIISRSEYESAQIDYINQKLDFSSSQENLDAVLDKANEENLEIAGMELANARATLEDVQKKLDRTTIYSPVSGIVIMPSSEGSSGGQEKKQVDSGSSVSQGDVLVSVGNLEGLSIKARVDEIDIGKIRFDMKVKVSGDAFSDIPMTGTVRQISSNARASGMEGPMFDVGVAIDSLTPDQKDRIRLGMSANLEIMVYENPEALIVPLSAVEIRGSEKWVRRRAQGGAEIQEIQVTTGMTTMEGVEIRTGLRPGDTVVLGPGGMAAPADHPASESGPPMMIP